MFLLYLILWYTYQISTSGRWNNLWKGRQVYLPIWLWRRLLHPRDTSLQGCKRAEGGKGTFHGSVCWPEYLPTREHHLISTCKMFYN